MMQCRYEYSVALSYWVTPGTMTVSLLIRASFSHVGLFANDVQRLAAFYCMVCLITRVLKVVGLSAFV